MIIKKAELETVCGITSTFPENTDPEIVFEIGRAPSELQSRT